MFSLTRVIGVQIIICIFFFNLTCCIHRKCRSEVLTCLPYLIENAVWRNWNQALIFTPDLEPGCSWAVLRLIKCLGLNGVAAALNVQRIPRFNINIGVIIFSTHTSRNKTTLINHMKQLNAWELNTAATDLIITTKSMNDFKFITSALNATELRFDQNIVVVFPDNRHEGKILGVCDGNFEYQRISTLNYNASIHRKNRKCSEDQITTHDCKDKEFAMNYYRTSIRYLNVTRNNVFKRNGLVIPLLRSGNIGFNHTRHFHMINGSDFSTTMFVSSSIKKTQTIHVVEYFKARVNSTLYASYLGQWSVEQSMSLMEMPYPVEARNFMGEHLIVGRCNYTSDEKSVPDEDGPSAPELLDDLLYFLTVRINGTPLTRYYSKLGFRTYEGVWSGLLGAMLDRTVDIALEPVTEQASRQQDMDFIFPIAETMYNIYIRNQETSSVRDIFLAPFSTRLLVCVAAVIIIAALTIVIITKISRSLLKNKSRTMSCSEALVWSTGILCQQGGTWIPSNPAASILLIVCLFFGLVTYNAYAAFITSVLSVRVANVGTVADVLHSPNMKIGYIKNGADQIYLMSTKDIQLNAFYIRGYSEAENLVSSPEEGLARAASQDYAFFVGQRAARSTLKSLSQARGRCALRELPVHSTRAQLSFPLPRRSPYSRPILVSLLQLRSGGTLSRLAASLVPAMPQCASPSGFASARAADVQTAFLVIVTGLIVSLLVGVGEYCWKSRKEKGTVLKKYYHRFIQLFR